jgi:hypothetical protein
MTFSEGAAQNSAEIHSQRSKDSAGWQPIWLTETYSNSKYYYKSSSIG